MTVPVVLLLVGALTAAIAPRVLSRADWPEREPVLALWVWQCVIAGVLICCVCAMALCASAAWTRVRVPLFAFAPHGVIDAYGLSAYGRWAGVLAALLAGGGAWTVTMLTREAREAHARRRRRRADVLARSPRLPGEFAVPGLDRLIVLESDEPDAWRLSGPRPRLVVTTAALRRLTARQLDAVLAHERGHARARHDLLLTWAYALAAGFPQVPVFADFRHQVHRLVELAADDAASRRFGRLTTALALVELNEDRGVFGPCPAPPGQLPGRVHRLLAPEPRLTPVRRLRVTATAALVLAVPLLITFGPAIRTLW